MGNFSRSLSITPSDTINALPAWEFMNQTGTLGTNLRGSLIYVGGTAAASNVSVITAGTVGVQNTVVALSIITAGTGYVTATPLVTTFTSIVPISNGPKVASGLTIGITATAGAVTAVTLVVAGEGYSIGDIITVVQAGGANCTLRVDAVRSFSPVAGDAVVFNNVPVGTVLPVYVDYVTATGTTATLLVAGV